MSPCSDEEYYKLDNMVIRSTHYLRQVFKERWKAESGDDWKNEPDDIQNILIQNCKRRLNKAIPLQKKILLESCNLEDWDLSLMSLVLLKLGDSTKYKSQNQAVRQLKDLRNDLAHHKSKKVSQNEYCKNVKILKASLETLKVKAVEIDKLIKESNVRSAVEDTDRLNVLLNTAEHSMKLKDFESALNQYSTAITIPRLSPENLGKVYEKRAACYLSIKEKPNLNGKHTEQAILDVDQALKLNKKSWNAHFLKAQCHKKKNNLPEAIRFYEMALAMSPTQKHVKKELDSCRLLHLSQKSNAHLNQDQLPFNVSDMLRDVNDNSGSALTLKNTFKLHGSQNHPVYLGEKYYYGLEVLQNYTKAIKYFTQADKQGFPTGTYKLGLCYYRGHGVQQDVSKAVEIYKRCAAMDARKRIQFESYSPLGYNKGVHHAENDIGKCYEQGTGVVKNIDQAVVWYRRAMEHGYGAGATNLGILYLKGDGLPENEKMAEMCWKQGLNFKNTVAAEYLVDYYRHQMEPEMAWIMLEIARDLGDKKYLEMSNEQFNRELTEFQIDRCRLEKYVLKFEQQQNVDFKGMTFKQRMIRAHEHLDPNGAKLCNNSTINSTGGLVQKIGQHDMMEVALRSANGSEIALVTLQTMHSIFQLNELLARQNDLSDIDKLKIVDMAYDCMLLEDHFKMFDKY